MKPKLLLIDDDDAIRELVTVALSPAFAVTGAPGARAGIATAAIELPDLILLDLTMPEMDGWQALSELKSDPMTRYIPVIMLTATAHVEDKVRGLGGGAEDYITKPFDPMELEARVKVVLERAAASRRVDHTTLLVNKPEVESAIIRRLARTDLSVAVAYVTIRNLDGVIDALGAERADRLLKWTASSLRSLADHREPDAVVGFMGESTFAYVGTPLNALPLSVELIKQFDREREGVLASHTPALLPEEVSLCIAVVTDNDVPTRSAEGIRHMAVELLSRAKRVHGSVMLTSSEPVRGQAAAR